MLIHFAEWDWEKDWVQQFHLGALRNNNSRMLQTTRSRYRLGFYRRFFTGKSVGEIPGSAG